MRKERTGEVHPIHLDELRRLAEEDLLRMEIALVHSGQDTEPDETLSPFERASETLSYLGKISQRHHVKELLRRTGSVITVTSKLPEKNKGYALFVDDEGVKISWYEKGEDWQENAEPFTAEGLTAILISEENHGIIRKLARIGKGDTLRKFKKAVRKVS